MIPILTCRAIKHFFAVSRKIANFAKKIEAHLYRAPVLIYLIGTNSITYVTESGNGQ